MKLIVLNMILLVSLYATQLSDYINTKDCDQVIDKQLYHICYSYKYKGALSGWVTLNGKLVNKKNIKKRERFYSESTIPLRYRTKYSDYTGYGRQWNRGHFIVADADFDYSSKSLRKAYTMANILPQSAFLNQGVYAKVERYGRTLATKLGTINSISIADYRGANKTIKNNIVIPSGFWRIYYSNNAKFEKCFYFENKLDRRLKNSKLKNHVVDCNSVKEILTKRQ